MKLISHAYIRRLGALLALDGLVFGLSSPARVPSFMLGISFLLLMVTVYQILLLILLAANWYGLPGRAHRRRQARVITGVISGLVALQSIGELGLRDVLVLLPLAFITYLYISYGRAAAESAPAKGREQQQPVSLLTIE